MASPEATTIRQWSRTARNEALIDAALDGSCAYAEALLSCGLADVDHRDPDGFTALMVTAETGHEGVTRILLDKGADVSIVESGGFNALHLSAYNGSLAVTKMLVEAGIDLGATTTAQRFTPLHLAAHRNQTEVMRVLIAAGARIEARNILGATPLHLAAREGSIEAILALIAEGSNPNSRTNDGSTPLYSAACKGRADVAALLLRHKANAMLAKAAGPRDHPVVPLDIATQLGHANVVRVLVQQRGISGCGGASGGVDAFVSAAKRQYVSILEILTAAGVVDTGWALIAASQFGREASVRFLVRQWDRRGADVSRYVNDPRDAKGRTPLICSINHGAGLACSPRVARLLVDAGADTTSGVHLETPWRGISIETPLSMTSFFLKDKRNGAVTATEDELHRLAAMRRLLLHADAVHAVSWLWSMAAPATADAAASRTNTTTGTPLTAVLPILKRRTRRHGVLLAALSTYSVKNDAGYGGPS